MSFDELQTRNLKCVTINNNVYPPTPIGINSIALNQVPVGTGNPLPSTVYTTSHLKVTNGIGQTKLSTDDGTALAIFDTMFPTDTGTYGQVLACDGSGTAAWTSPKYPTSILVPWTAFNYYNLTADVATNLWFKVAGINSLTPDPVTNAEDLGTVIVPLKAGTWRFSLTLSGATNTGILNVTINGNTQSIDSYTLADNVSFNWEETIATDGDYTVNYTSGGKNASSSGYDIQGRNTMGLMGVWLGP